MKNIDELIKDIKLEISNNSNYETFINMIFDVTNLNDRVIFIQFLIKKINVEFQQIDNKLY